MGLFAPLALLGAIAVALPIIAHLVRRRDVPTRSLPTIMLLRRAEAHQRRRVRVADPWLLAARIAMVALATLALAGPFVTHTLAFGDGRVASVAIVLDDSLSMSRRAGEGNLLDVALDRAQEIGDALPAGSEVALVLAGGPARVALARSSDESALASALSSVRADEARRTAMGDALELASRQLSGARHPVRRIVVLTDGATHTGLSELTLPRDVRVDVERLDASAAETGPENLSITDARAVPDPTTPGEVSVEVTLRAFATARTSVPVVLRREGQEVARAEAAIESGGARVTLHVALPETADPSASVALVLDPPDALPGDDARGLLLRRAAAVRVLLVDGDPRPLGRRDRRGSGEEVRFLARALGVAPPARPISFRSVDAAALGGASLEDVDVLVLANVALAPGLERRLREHVERGGGLIIATGDRVESSDYARLTGLLPARVLADGGGAAGMRAGPACASVLETGTAGLDGTIAETRTVLELEPEGRVVLAWSDGMPALVVGPPGSRVALLGIPIDDAWSDLPFRPGFVALAAQLVHAMAPPGRMPDSAFAAGETPALALPEGTRAVALISPSGRVLEPELQSDDTVDLSVAAEPGAWRVQMAGEGGLREESRAAFVIAAPAAESDLTPGPLLETDAQSEQDAALGPSTVRSPLAPWVFLLFGLLALAEAALRLRSAAPTGARAA